MENKFKEVMSKRTDEELIKIITIDKEGYEPLAVEAANKEIESRNIDINSFQEIIEQATSEKKKKEETDSTSVSSFIRFLNFIIDFIIFLVIGNILGFVSSLVIQTTDPLLIRIIGYFILFGSFLGYYIFMENKYQKTLGKFITNTKVVTLNGSKPELNMIVNRSLCRLIPFDRISFLFRRNGIHDFLSKTTVIKDSIK